MGIVLNSVFDSLDVRLFRHAQPSLRLRRDADIWRELIANFEPGDAPQFVQLPGLGTFRIKMGGRAPYEFVLMNPQVADIRIWNPDRWHTRAAAQTGQLYVSFRSVFMQRFGLYGVRSALEGLTDLFCQPGEVHAEAGPEFDRVARVDLALDTQEKREMVWADLDRFVCKARKLDTWAHLTPANIEELLKIELNSGTFLPMEDPAALDSLPALARSSAAMIHRFVEQVVNDLETHGQADLSRVVSHNRKPQTVYFGRFGSKLYARRYNKLGSLIVQNKLYMQQVWLQNGWDGESAVLRTEFSISGDFLKDFTLLSDGAMIEDCRDLSLLEHVAPVLWDYLVTDWLTMRDPVASDSNYRRWPLAQEWACMAGAFGQTDMAAQRNHQRAVPREDEHLVKQARGCSVSTVALRSVVAGGYDQALQSMVDDLVFRMSDDEFRDDVQLRLLEYGLDEFTDTQLSAMFRQERMLEKTGS